MTNFGSFVPSDDDGVALKPNNATIPTIPIISNPPDTKQLQPERVIVQDQRLPSERAKEKEEEIQKIEVEKFIPNDMEDDYSARLYNEQKDIEEMDKEMKSISRSKGIGCKAMGCIVSIIIAITIFLIIYFQPPFVIEPLKSFMNSEYGNLIPQSSSMKMEDINIASGEIVLSEPEILGVLNTNGIKISRVELQQDNILFFFNLAESGNPLWIIVTIKNNGEQYVIERIGFGRVALPSVIKEKLIDSVFNAVGSTANNNIINTFLPPYLKANSVKFEEDKMTITIVDTSNIFEDFDIQKIINDNIDVDYLNNILNPE